MGQNKQLLQNMIAQLGVFCVIFIINFFLTPYIVKHLGVEAYGFIGLSNSILGYLQIATVALNSMAGRFITIAYHRGDTTKANMYFSSVFYANVFISSFILFVSGVGIIFLEHLIEIPSNLICDVKLLFALLSFNSILSFVTNVYIVSPFIKNRIDITAIQNLISNFIRLVILILLFAIFPAHLWYIGISAILCSVYLVVANYCIKNKFTPDLGVSPRFFDYRSILEITKSGVWNLLGKLGELLQRGFDLLFANWFINATAMGILSVTTQLPFLILQVFQLMSNSFAPVMTKDFAEGNFDAIKNELHKSIRIMSIITIIPISILYIYGDVFYALWVPGQDSHLLQNLTIVGTFALLVTTPLEGFWNVFTVTNKIKGSSIFMLINSIAVFFTVFVSLLATDSTETKMFIIAGTRSVWGVLRGLLFLPLYASHCLGLKKGYFYPMLIKPIAGLTITILLLYLLRLVFIPNTWLTLVVAGFVVCVLSAIVGSFMILRKTDLLYLKNQIYDKIKK